MAGASGSLHCLAPNSSLSRRVHLVNCCLEPRSASLASLRGEARPRSKVSLFRGGRSELGANWNELVALDFGRGSSSSLRRKPRANSKQLQQQTPLDDRDVKSGARKLADLVQKRSQRTHKLALTLESAPRRAALELIVCACPLGRQSRGAQRKPILYHVNELRNAQTRPFALEVR